MARVATLLLLAGLSAASATYNVVKTFNFGGGLPTCSQCGAPGGYACSEKGIGRWNNGSFSFADPLQYNTILHQVTITVTGSFGCDPQRPAPTLQTSLNGVVIDAQTTRLSPGKCACGSCDGDVVITAEYPAGLPQYNYGGSNSISLVSYGNFICVNSISLNMTASESSATLPTWYGTFTPFWDTGSSACSACAGLRAMRCFDRWITYTYSLQDPLPANSLLLAVRVHVFGQYFCSASSGTAATNSIAVSLTGTLVEEKSVSTRSASCPCVGCDGGLMFNSQAVYQAGWPNYEHGKTNSLNIRANGGKMCLGRFDIILTYYNFNTNSVQETPLKIDGAKLR